MSDITYSEEDYKDLVEDIKVFLEGHFQETSPLKDTVKMSPNYDFYKDLSETDSVRFYTARDDGKLIAYSIFFVTSHPHFKENKVAENDMLYVAKEYRGKDVSDNLLSFTEECLSEEGITSVGISVKTTVPFDSLLIKNGYSLTERKYNKILEKRNG